MPVNISIEMISQATFDQFEATLLNLIRTHHPEMDVRRGTALRDLLVAKATELAAINSGNYDHLTQLMTLQMNADAAAEDIELVESILTNFDVERRVGVAASGKVIVYVNVYRDYFVPSGVVFSNGDMTYSVAEQISVDGSGDALAEYRVQPAEADGLYYFVIPVVASVAGAAYNLDEGVELDLVADLGTGVTGSAVYEAIAGGADQETMDELMARLPQAVAYKDFVTPASISAKLHDQFAAVKDVSVIGMGDAEMLRDKHNVFSNAVGSRVDVYVRTSYTPEEVVLTKNGIKVSDGVYTIIIDREDAPGFYLINAVTDTDSVIADEADGAFALTGSLHPFVEVRTADDLANTFHDFSSTNAVVETAYSAWQGATLTVSNVPAAKDGTWPAVREFKLSVYRPASLGDIQDYVDDTELRNKESDCVVRGAIPCFVKVSVPVYKLSSVTLDTLAMRTAIVDMINRLPFGASLTMSQLASLLHTFDIVRVGLDVRPGEFELTGSIRAADGSTISLSGGSINLASLDSPELLVTGSTTVLMAALNDVSIDVRNV